MDLDTLIYMSEKQESFEDIRFYEDFNKICMEYLESKELELDEFIGVDTTDKIY